MAEGDSTATDLFGDKIVHGKRCVQCGRFKAFADFALDKARIDGRQRWCRPCHAIRRKEIRKKRGPEKCKEYRRYGLLKYKFGITERRYQEMVAAQNGVCAICGSPPKRGRWPVLHIDHCHKTGKIRGLLCDTCNKGIGFFQDNATVLRKAAVYVESHAV